MFTRLGLTLLSAFAGLGALAAPLVDRAVTAVSAAELAGFAPYTQFARAAYCPTSKLNGWACGGACNAVSGFTPTLIGGDGNIVQIYFVGYWSTKNTVVVAHQGTDPTQLVSILTDINILLDPLDPAMFPGAPSDILVHSGFQNAHALTATKILAEVKRLISTKGATSVTLVGHSLGGALATLDALYLRLNLPSNIGIKGVTFGMPRVGNPAFASFFDSKIPDFKRINNEKDIVPIVPGRFLGFSHVKGEVHILSPGKAVACSGNDNEADAQCQISSVPNIFSGSILDHLGPYEGINIGTIYCN